MKRYDVALIGLGVMGQSLARNIASQKFRVLTYNRTTKKAVQFIEEYGNDYLDYKANLKALVKELKTPRKIILMVPAGKPVDDMIQSLAKLLSKNDILIDAGNSLFKETIRRNELLKKKGIHFVGMGVSGGEEGALRGPSIMPGCDAKVWKSIRPILTKIAAKDFKGKPCVTHVGTDGAGHYVKMVHNGIEYAVMQMMAEAYEMLKSIYGLKPNEIANVFSKYNRGRLKSYLFEISVPVLSRKDDFKKGYLIDFILDKAGQKGTGRWTVIDALERGAVIPTIAEAVFARSLSSNKTERIVLSKLYKTRESKNLLSRKAFVKQLESALYAGMISCYAQGFELIRLAAEQQNWKLNFAEIARIWEGGCIIRADLLNFIHKAFASKRGKPVHLFMIGDIKKALQKDAPALSEVVSLGARSNVPIAAMATAHAYLYGMTSSVVPANFIQGLRDFFGAHTYERADKKGIFHTPWSNLDL